jgi:protein SCO1
MSKNKLQIVIITVVLIIIAATIYMFRQEEAPAPTIHGVLLDTPKPLVTVALKDMHGNPFTDQSFMGDWSLVFFGFTSCPDICPTTLSLLNQVVEKIKVAPGVPMPQVVFVSVDPARDTPEKLTEYVQHFNKDFIGVTGNETQLTNFSRQLGVVYEKFYPSKDSPDYVIDHSGSIALINRRGAIVAFFTTPLDANIIAKEYGEIVTHLSPCTLPTN